MNYTELKQKAIQSYTNLEYIAQFDEQDIDGDSVDLRFEDEYGNETGCDISITKECETASHVIKELMNQVDHFKKEARSLTDFKNTMAFVTENVNNGTPLDLSSLLNGELASSMFAVMFASEFKTRGATNYLELVYDVPGFGDFTVTTQKREGTTPGQRVAELEQVCSESYQVVGELSGKLDVFNTLPVIKAMDNLSAAKLVHNDVLPFEIDYDVRK